MEHVARFAQLLAANDLVAARSLAAGLPEPASTVATAAIDAHPTQPARARMHVATLHMMAGQYAEAVPLLRAVIEETPRDRDAHMNLAVAAYRLADYGTALSGFARAFDLDPNDRAPLHNLMSMFADMGKWVGALAILDLMRRGDPPADVSVALDLVSIQLLQLVANTYPSLGTDGDADATVKDLLVNASKRGPRSQLAAARALCDIERYAEATKLVHNLARDPSLTKPERADLYYIEGLLASNDNYTSTAIERYTRSVAADPTRVDAATNAISLLLGEGSPASLTQIAAVLEQVEPEARASAPGLLFNEAIYLNRIGQREGARANLERVLALANGNPDIIATATRALSELA